MAATRLDYPADGVEASLSVLVEVFTILGEYRDSIALVGGWVPYVRIPSAVPPHVGSLDVDIAVSFASVTDDNYASIRALMEKHGYKQHERDPYRFERTLLSSA